MSRSSIHISIPKPCHEQWDGMTATERGAFCQSCQTEVIDFSTMTDREVVEYLSKNNTGCGRFRNDQLNTNLVIPSVENGMFKWRILLMGFISLLSVKNLLAQSDNKAPITQNTIPKAEQINNQSPAISDTIVLKEVSVESTVPARHLTMGIVAMEMPIIKPIATKLDYEYCEDPKPQKHKLRDWFRHTFRIKHKQ